jgi:methionyl-tRNA formyltransferase
VLCFVADFNAQAGTMRAHARPSLSCPEPAVKIVLLGHEDLPSLYALQRLIAAIPNHDYTVLLSGDLPVGNDRPTELQHLADADARLCAEFRARGQLAKPLVDAALLPQPNTVGGRAILEVLEPDLVVSVRYRRILKREAIAIPRLGVLNLHSGVLPDYKGVMATFWAMLHNEKEIGATLHRIVDDGIDTGPVIGVRRIPADYGATYLANVLRLYGPGCDMIVEAIETLEAGGTPPVAAQPPGGRYFSTPGSADVDAFGNRGLVLANGLEVAGIEMRKT